MQRAGIIEPSESPWASPVVMVPKKGGEWRFCVDYRRLNDVTKKDSYPLPRVDECLDLVAGSSWFSSLDLRSGYWQVPLAEEARPKTAFCTGKGLWQFKVLCFGLCNAPATFERLMERVLAGVPHTECLVYLDDILAHGNSFDSAMAALRKVMKRIKGAGLKLHPDKCRLLCRELTFLGHRIGSEGIGTVEEKVRAIHEWPTPTDQRGLKRFLGLASYYRKFVRGFSGIAAPLYRLLQKDQPFVWAEDCKYAFNTLQEALSSAPILAAPDPEVPFVLDTDASGDGVGAVLSQAWPEGERVVAYYSKALNKAERRYCVTRREMLAVVFAARHFKYYLCGRPFTVRTDHASLQWLMTFREPEGQLARWLEELQGYEFSVVHRAGERHGNADALSRRPCTEDGCRYCDRREAREQQLVLGPNKRDREECEETGMACRELLVVDSATWAAEQQQDPDMQPVMLWVEARQRPPWEERAWLEPASGEKKWQTVVPRGMQGAVLKAMHGSAGSGHFGVTKTLRRVRQAFYWGRLRRDVEDFCRCCDVCTARKGPPGQSRAQLQQFPVGEPMQRLGVDVLGPLPLTDRGNRYILATVDYFTKWPEAYAIKDQEAETIVDALVEGIISRLGVPESIHSDQGRNFESKIFATMCTRLGITKTRTTPLHPQSDGLVERFNRTLGEQLAILTADHQRDWDMHLPLVLMACRTAVHDSTSCTPSLLMLGRELRTPAELAFGRPPDAPRVPAGPDYARRLQDRLDSAHAYARRQMRSAGVRQKRNYDVRAKGRHFAAGELVWTYTPKRKKGRCPKLDSHWVGPCLVLERLGEVVYRVQMPGRGRRVALHRDRLAPYRGIASPQTAGEEEEMPWMPVVASPNREVAAGSPGDTAIVVASMAFSTGTLAQGAFGKVYKQKYNDTWAAIKKVPQHLINGKDLERECEVYKDIVHQDLKPDNIMTNRAVIIDLGLAKFFKFGLNSAMDGGIPAYSAPEVLQRGTYRDQRSDVWAMGKIIAELCARIRLHTLSVCPAKIKEVMGDQPYCNSVCRMVDPNPSLRASVGGVMHEIRKAAGASAAINTEVQKDHLKPPQVDVKIPSPADQGAPQRAGDKNQQTALVPAGESELTRDLERMILYQEVAMDLPFNLPNTGQVMMQRFEEK
ncbi:uncharacterized protein clasp1b [Pungitius pungitius]|uniref:uncharacterized protein clasp1b n=1 Tax=Pungitius pungitius TaxID=134920 RepID=UPI002E15E52D